MRVLIMADLEGVSGIIRWEQTGGDSPLYQEARRLYTEELNASVRGAISAGAKDIVIVDCHGAGGGYQFNSIVPELLHPEAQWVAGHMWGRYTEFLEQGADACLLVGMHGRAGTPDAVLSHTISTVNWANMWFNDDHVGELGINAALCGHYGCPIALVTGDEATCHEAREILGENIPALAVKKGLSRYSARQVAPVKARRLIEEATKSALVDMSNAHVYVPGKPTEISFTVHTIDKIDGFRGKPNVEIIEKDRLIKTRGADWMEAWNHIWPWSL